MKLERSTPGSAKYTTRRQSTGCPTVRREKGWQVELRWVEAFIAVAEELHFGRAADRISMAQSPMSQVIRKLERELGTALFERSTRVVALTDAGRAFLPHARAILGEVDLGKRATAAAAGGIYGNVALGFAGALNHRTLPPLTRAVRTRYPNISLSLEARVLTVDAIEQLRNHSVDLAFVGMPVIGEHLASRLVAVEELAAMLPADHPLAGAPGIELAQLASDEFVTMPLNPGSTLRERTMLACMDAGFRPRIAQEVFDPYLVLSLVAAGVGVSLMPAGMQSIMPAGCVSVPLARPAPILETGLAWRADDRSKSLVAVLEVAEQVLPTPDWPPERASATDSARRVG